MFLLIFLNTHHPNKLLTQFIDENQFLYILETYSKATLNKLQQCVANELFTNPILVT
jgi:hypothetical protein